MPRTPQDELVHFLSDMYSVELQALAQLVTAPKMAGDPAIAEDFRLHHAETERQAELVRGRLEACGGSPSAIKDAVMKLGGKAFLAFAKAMPETAGRLVAHAYSYEAMEWAGYEMLIRFATRAGDGETARVARAIRDEERTMMERLERHFDAAEQASHASTHADELVDHVRKHLTEAHAIESQSIRMLEKGESIGGNAMLEQIYRGHLEETRTQAWRLEQRLGELGADRSALKDAVLSLGAMNWGLFFQAQSDTPAKLAAFAYAFEHLEIAGYELLRRTAWRAGDAETQRLCEEILAEERAMCGRLVEAFDGAVTVTLEEVAG